MPLINALLPLIRLLQITSINPFSINYLNSKRFNALSISSIILLIFLTIHGIVNPNFYITVQISIGNTILFLKLCGVRLCHIIILIESYVKRGELMKLLNILSSIDEVLAEKLGIEVDHKKLRKILLICLTVTFMIVIVIECTVLLIVLNHSRTSFLMFWLARLFSLSTIALRYFQIITFIYIIQSRVSIINFILIKLGTHLDDSRGKFISNIGFLEEDNRDVLKRQTKQFTDFEKISILRDLFGRLWDATNFVNQCFGISMLVCIGNDFGAVTLSGYWMYISYKQSTDVTSIFGTALWSLPHFIFLLMIASFSYRAVERANETSLIIHKINYNSVDGIYRNLDSRIEQFSLQLLHQKPVFQACGFFVIDFTLIFTIIGAITTYLVILIQFHMSN